MALLKFTDKDAAQKILNGHLRFSNVKLYHNIENSIYGQQDKNEGAFVTQKYRIPTSEQHITFKLTSKRNTDYALCLFEKDDINVCDLYNMEEFGKYIVVIYDKTAFLKRIIRVTKQYDKYLIYQKVFYYSESIEDEIKIQKMLTNGLEYFAFIKQKDKFEYQNEFRCLIPEGSKIKEDFIDINIESIEDIAEIMHINQFINKMKGGC